MDKKSLKIDTSSLSEENLLQWDRVQENLKENLGLQIYTSWLKRVCFLTFLTFLMADLVFGMSATYISLKYLGQYLIIYGI